MRFHPNKCKVISIISNRNRLAYLLPCSRFSYSINNVIHNYEKSEVDLGVTINDQFTWSDQQQKVTTKASQMLGVIKRTCHFLINSKRKRT